ncbi:MAG: pyridoxal-phosphate dependent enzyme [Actinomycetia bacterium]|nr:pyridoxal-phosphate dependent enzyme [Actinomycetes bacterium]
MSTPESQDAFAAVGLTCSACGRAIPVGPAPVCPCGGVLDVNYDWERLSGWQPEGAGASRYEALLPFAPDVERITLGEGKTPVLETDGVLLKCEHLNPTGSYKDRIGWVAINVGVACGSPGWVGSSSGNAGSAFSAYGARAGLRGTLFTAADVAPQKLAQMAIFGTEILFVDDFMTDPQAAQAAFGGIRTLAVRRQLVLGVTARTYNPVAMEGAKTIAYELNEQLGEPPQAVYVPTGGGGLLSSIWAGFRDWRRLGLAAEAPRMIAVQPSGCAPIHKSFLRGDDRVTPVGTCVSQISGLQLPAPPDGDLVLAALRESNGFSVAVSDERAHEAQRELAKRYGVFVEPAAALAYAGYQARPEARAVVILTGSGLKSSTWLDDATIPTIRAEAIERL